MEFSQRLDGIETRFDELTRQMADPAVIGDSDTYARPPNRAANLNKWR